MHTLVRSSSAPGRFGQESPPESPAYVRLMDGFTACAAALTQEPSPNDRRAALQTPLVEKDRGSDHCSVGTMGLSRRMQRRAIASGSYEVGDLETSALMAGVVLAMATLCAVNFVGATVYGVRRLAGHFSRSLNGVREDKVLRVLAALKSDICKLDAEHDKMTAASCEDLWLRRCRKVIQQFDALEWAIVNHPSVRLRGSPLLRNALLDVAAAIKRIDPLQPRCAWSRFAVLGAPTYPRFAA